MEKISAAVYTTPVYGFVVDGKFYDWEVLEALAEEEYYFFHGGSQKAESLINAGIAYFSDVGDGSIVGTPKAKEVYRELLPTISERSKLHAPSDVWVF